MEPKNLEPEQVENRITGNLSKLPDVSIIRRWIRKRIKAYQEDLEVMHREAAMPAC